MRKEKAIVSLFLVAAAFGWAAYHLLAPEGTSGAARRAGGQRAEGAPVAVAAVERGAIELRRVFSGTLESPVRFVVAPKLAGQVEKLHVDIGDRVERGQVVVELDDDEYVQAVAQAEADLAVAQANLSEARSSLEIARREFDRVKTLRQRGMASESQLDLAESESLARGAAVQVAEAQVTRAQASLETAKIRLGYTRIVASWPDRGDAGSRLVGERFVEIGETVAANTDLLSIVELDPINAIVYVTEKDYARMHIGQPAILRTDAFPDRTFQGHITRIAPVFRQASRQARIEIRIANPDHALKPGMFARAQVVLDRVESATIVPVAALTRRNGVDGVFVVDETGDAVRWRPVVIGIRQDDDVQVIGDGVTGRVVTLGQQLINDGSKIVIPDKTMQGAMR